MDLSERPVSVERLPGSGRRTELLAAFAMVVLGLLVVKPWASQSAVQRASSSALPLSSPVPSIALLDGSGITPAGDALRSPAPSEIVCRGSWELVSLTRLATWSVREWLPALPRAASGPTDPQLSPLQLADGPVRALGVCGDGTATGTAIFVRRSWRVDSEGSPSPVELQVQPDAAGAPPPDLAILYRPAGVAPSQPWPNGRYVLELETPEGSQAGWMAVVIGRPAG